jgi:hypothetical protein
MALVFPRAAVFLVAGAATVHGFALAAATPEDRPKLHHLQKTVLREKALLPALGACVSTGALSAYALGNVFSGFSLGTRAGVAIVAGASLAVSLMDNDMYMEQLWVARTENLSIFRPKPVASSWR